MSNKQYPWLKPVMLGTLAASVVLSVLAHFYSRFPGDLDITLWLQSFHNQAFLAAMQAVSWLFDGWRTTAIVLAGFIVLLLLSKQREALLFGVAGAAASVSSVIKAMVGRPRPSPVLISVLDAKTDASFPSGHALFVTAVLGFTAYLCIRHIENRWVRNAAVAILIGVILATGASRIYLGAHWASDVLGGYLTGGFILAMAIWAEIKSRAMPSRITWRKERIST